MPLKFDARWLGAHGIGRVAAELRDRTLESRQWAPLRFPRSPLNPLDPLIQGLGLAFRRRDCIYSPGFNPPLFGSKRSIFTIHDLIHVRIPEESGRMKIFYYEKVIKPAVRSCFRVLTVSEYSRQDILQWSGASEQSVLNVGNGVDPVFFTKRVPWSPGFPYFLYVGARKPHKNLPRLLEAYARSRAAASVRLVLSGETDPAISALAERLGICDRLRFAGHIPDMDLPAYYQGATALLFPSLFEGFGFPPVEAMAGGTPVLSSNATCMPETLGNAALMVDPWSVDALCEGINRIFEDQTLRTALRNAGPQQARKHSWQEVASKVNAVLDELTNDR